MTTDCTAEAGSPVATTTVGNVTGRRLAALVIAGIAGVTTVACSAGDSGVTAVRSSPVTTEPASTDPPATTDPPTTEPDTTEPDTTEPDTTEPDTTVSPTRSDPDGIGDVLYPELGNPGIDVVDVTVAIRYDPEVDTVAGAVTLLIDATDERDEFTLDAVGLDVSGVTVDGEPVVFGVEERELRITPPTSLTTGDRIEVTVTYTATPDAAASAGLPNGWFHTDGGSYVLNEPDGGRTWMPSNDHPSDKSTWTFEITVPTGTTAVANGDLVSSGPATDGPGDTWVWREDDPMPTYLIQLLTGDYEVIESTTADGLPVIDVALRNDVERMRPYFASIQPQIDFFEEQFGPYPLDRYGLAFTDSFGGLAMETQGRSLFSRDDFPGDVGYVQELLLAHELAHQWYGNAVTPGVWQDIWLNESFATYAQWLWLDHIGLQPLDDAAASALQGRQGGGSAGGFGSAASPTGTPTVDDLFGFNTYDGGAVVLEALRRTIGDEPFAETLQRWVSENIGTSVATADFIALAERVSGQDLTLFFDSWLYASEIPGAYPSFA